jgi:hypothetical protein
MKRPPASLKVPLSHNEESSEEDDDEHEHKQQVAPVKRHSGTIGNSKFQCGSKGALPSPLGSAHSFDLQVMKRVTQFLMSYQRNDNE